MADYQIFFFIVLPMVIGIMIGIMIAAMHPNNYDNSGQQVPDTFEQMNDGGE